MVKDLVIVGASDFGREVEDLVKRINQQNDEWNLLGFVDDCLVGETLEGTRILGPISYLYDLLERPYVVIAIANTTVRKKIATELYKRDFKFATLIDPSVIISSNFEVDHGSIICAGTIFAINTKVGKHCIINLGCRIGHDTVLGDYSSLMPGTNLAGNVIVGAGCYFGLNACVINNTHVGAWSTIGAGAAVVKDIPDNVVAVGVPARVIKKLEAGREK